MRKDNSRLPPPLGRCFPPTHHPGLPGKGPAWPAGADLGEGGKRGSQPLPGFPPPPSLIGCASLEPNFSRSRLCLSPKGAGVQRPGAGHESGGRHLWGPRGEGRGRGRPPQPLPGPARRVSRPRLLSAPRPFLPSQQRPPSSSGPPTPPATSPRFLIPATSALGGSFRGRRQPRGASRADAAGAARSRRRLVNGTRTEAGVDTAPLVLCQGPTARSSRPPSRAPGEVRRQSLPLDWMGLFGVGGVS